MTATYSLDVPPNLASIIITGAEGSRSGPETRRKREWEPKDTRPEGEGELNQGLVVGSEDISI